MNSALLYLRSLPMNNGDERTLALMTATGPYLATIKVVGRGRVRVEAGEFAAIECSLSLEKINKNGELEPRKGFKTARRVALRRREPVVGQSGGAGVRRHVTVESGKVSFGECADALTAGGGCAVIEHPAACTRACPASLHHASFVNAVRPARSSPKYGAGIPAGGFRQQAHRRERRRVEPPGAPEMVHALEIRQRLERHRVGPPVRLAVVKSVAQQERLRTAQHVRLHRRRRELVGRRSNTAVSEAEGAKPLRGAAAASSEAVRRANPGG